MTLKKVIGLITARGGSKRLPRKNVLQVGGRPLIAWTITAAMESKVIDEVILSSDDEEIIEIAKAMGCSVPFRRPDHLSDDRASSIDVVLHALDELPKFDFIILLQPTSPLRTAQDIDNAFMLLKKCGASSCVSVSEVEQSPYWMYRLNDDKSLHNILPMQQQIGRMQDLPNVYILNGAIYIAQTDWLKKTKNFITPTTVAYVMEKCKSVDIDTPKDFEFFRYHIESLNTQKN